MKANQIPLIASVLLAALLAGAEEPNNWFSFEPRAQTFEIATGEVISQQINDLHKFSPGAAFIRLPGADVSTFKRGSILLGRLDGGKYVTWLDYEEYAVGVIEADGVQVAVFPFHGWERGVEYAIHLRGTVKTNDGVPFNAGTWVVEIVGAPTPQPANPRGNQRADQCPQGRFPGGQPLLYQGAWTDPLTGLAYHRGRWYDPRTGTWLTPDPMGTVDSVNRYAFVGWAPHMATDPTGLASDWNYAPSAPRMQERREEVRRVRELCEAFPERCEMSPREKGFLMFTGGVLEAGIGGAGCLFPEGASSIAGCPLALHSVDTMTTAWQMLLENREHRTYTFRLFQTGLETGLSPSDAEEWAGFLEMAAIGGLSGYSAGLARVSASESSAFLAEAEAAASREEFSLFASQKSGVPTRAQGPEGTGPYFRIRGHHVHAKSAFRGHATYDPQRGFSVSQEFMEGRGWSHADMTRTQRRLFDELAASGRPNTLKAHTRIAVESLMSGGATAAEARSLVALSLSDLRAQLVLAPTRIPWN